jgi:dTDP-4-amino-4,6-dideoxygalactose transaminase
VRSDLAINGGPAVLPEGPPSWPRPDEAIKAALDAAYVDGSWGRYHGPHCERLGESLTQLSGARHAWPCCSGTIAVEIALRGLKIGSGDEVILAAYDFPGNFRAIEAVGARPVLVDIAPGTWTLDIDQVAAAISTQTKAIIVSHLHGSLADMPCLRELADQHGLAIVEDACQVPGALIAGKPTGSWGDCGVFSFGGSKLLTAGRGGAIVTNRDDVLQRIKIACERGNNAFPLSDLQAAMLLPQLSRLSDDNAHRQESVDLLLNECQHLPRLQSLQFSAGDQNKSAFYKLPWLLMGTNDACDSADFEQVRRIFLAAIQAEGVAIDEGFRGFTRRTSQRCRVVGDLINARRAAAGTVILHHPVLLQPRETVLRVAGAIRKVAQALLTA